MQVDKTDLVTQTEQAIGRPKQRQVDDVFGALCRFDLAVEVLSSPWDGRRVAFSARCVSNLRRSGDSVLIRRTLTLPPVLVNSLAMLSLGRQMLGLRTWSVLRDVFSRSPWWLNEPTSCKVWDRCDPAAWRFSSTPTSVLVDDDSLYNSQHCQLHKKLLKITFAQIWITEIIDVKTTVTKVLLNLVLLLLSIRTVSYKLFWWPFNSKPVSQLPPWLSLFNHPII